MTTILAVAWTLLWIALVPIPRSFAQENPSPSAARIAQIRNGVEKMDSPLAIDFAKQGILDFPKNATVHGLYGCALVRIGRFKEARREADLALSLDANDYWGLIASARIYHWENNYRQALTLLDKATTLAPQQDTAWAWLHLVLQDDLPETDEDRRQWQVLYARMRGHFVKATAENGYFRLTHLTAEGSRLTHADKKKAPPLSVTLSYEHRQRGPLSIPVTIHGQKFHFAFKTKADGLILNKAAADRLHLKYQGKERMTTMHGFFKGDATLLDNIVLDTLAVHDVPTVVNGTEEDLGNLDGVLGVDLFRQCVITIDSLKKTITFALPTAPSLTPRNTPSGNGTGQPVIPDGKPYEDGVHRMHFSYYQQRIVFPAAVGARRVMALFDTGTVSEIVSRSLAEKTLQDPIDPSKPSKAASDEDYLYTGREATITLDLAVPFYAFIEPELAGTSILDTNSRSREFDIDVYLGLPFTELLAEVKIDFPNRELTLTQRQAEP